MICLKSNFIRREENEQMPHCTFIKALHFYTPFRLRETTNGLDVAEADIVLISLHGEIYLDLILKGLTQSNPWLNV